MLQNTGKEKKGGKLWANNELIREMKVSMQNEERNCIMAQLY